MIFFIANVWVYTRYPLVVLRFRRNVGYWPNVADPATFQELVMWRKFFDHDPKFEIFLDKLKAKDLAGKLCPELEIPPTVWRGKRAADLPEKFNAPGYVIKTNHGSGYNYFPHREPLDQKEMVKLFSRRLSRTFGATAGEWGYSIVRPEVFVEALIGATSGAAQFFDVSIWVIAGKAARGAVLINNKTKNLRYCYFDLEGQKATVGQPPPDKCLPDHVAAPSQYGTAVDLAEKIAGQQDFVRVDFMCIGDEIHFSEITLYPAGGFSKPNATTETIVSAPWAAALDRTWFLSQRQPFPLSIYQKALANLVAARNGAAPRSV